MIITTALLRNLNACKESLDWLHAVFADEVVVTPESLAQCQHDHWVCWLACRIDIDSNYQFWCAGVAFREAASVCPELARFSMNVNKNNWNVAYIDADSAARAASASSASARAASASCAFAAYAAAHADHVAFATRAAAYAAALAAGYIKNPSDDASERAVCAATHAVYAAAYAEADATHIACDTNAAYAAATSSKEHIWRELRETAEIVLMNNTKTRRP